MTAIASRLSHCATSRGKALAVLREGVRPQLIVILSDINMPGTDGLTLLGKIKKSWPTSR